MNVTQNDCSCSSDQKRRQSSLCYKPLFFRLLCIMLVVATFATSVIQVQASPVEPIIYDIFSAGSYTYYKDGVRQAATQDPSVYFEKANTATWRWLPYIDLIFTYSYLTVYAQRKPDEVRVKYYGADQWHVAELIGNNGYVYQYKVSCGVNIHAIDVEGYWASDYTGQFDIFSMFGVRDHDYKINKVNARHIIHRRNNTTGVETYDENVSVTGVSVPYSRNVSSSITNSDFVNTYVYLDIPPDYRGYNYAKDISYLLYATSGVVSTAQIELVNSNKNVVAIVPCDILAAPGNSVSISNVHDQICNYWQISADLSKYSLGGLTVRLSFVGTPALADSGSKEFNYELVSCYLTPDVEIPWYSQMWRWISSKWNSVTTDIKSSISSAASTIKSSISSAADKITSAFSGSSAQNNALKDAGQAMSDQAASMNQAQDQLDSVDKPSVDPDSLFGDILTYDTGGLKILSAITSNGQVTAMLVVVFTFALCGYVFFGKKG